MTLAVVGEILVMRCVCGVHICPHCDDVAGTTCAVTRCPWCGYPLDVQFLNPLYRRNEAHRERTEEEGE